MSIQHKYPRSPALHAPNWNRARWRCKSWPDSRQKYFGTDCAAFNFSVRASAPPAGIVPPPARRAPVGTTPTPPLRPHPRHAPPHGRHARTLPCTTPTRRGLPPPPRAAVTPGRRRISLPPPRAHAGPGARYHGSQPPRAAAALGCHRVRLPLPWAAAAPACCRPGLPQPRVAATPGCRRSGLPPLRPSVGAGRRHPNLSLLRGATGRT